MKTNNDTQSDFVLREAIVQAPPGWESAANGAARHAGRGIVLAFMPTGEATLSLADKSTPSRELVESVLVEWLGPLTILAFEIEVVGRPVAFASFVALTSDKAVRIPVPSAAPLN